MSDTPDAKLLTLSQQSNFATRPKGHRRKTEMRLHLFRIIAALIISQNCTTAFADDLSIFTSDCEAIPKSKPKIDKCLALIAERKVSKTYFPPVYLHVAFAFGEMKDYDEAIKYTRLEIQGALENLREHGVTGSMPQIAREANLKAMSKRYERLGTFLAMKRLTSGDRLTTFETAKAERSSYEMAIHFNSESHTSYMQRAEIGSLLCNPAEAANDLSKAIQLAKRANDERALKNYTSASLPSCEESWRKR
ncbi:hypothetical protein ACO2JO_18535 [Leptospira interrogans]